MIHSSAYVDKDAEIADGVRIGPLAVVMGRTRIGEGTEIGPQAVIQPYVTIGRRCRIHPHAVLGDLPQDLSFGGGESYVHIGDDCRIREGVTVHRGTKAGTATEIGDRCFLMANSHVAHNCMLGDDVILANGCLLGGYVSVGDRAFISGNAVIHQFTRIGRLAILSGLSGIGKDVPPFCTAAGVRRNVIAGLNVVGLRRAGIGPKERLQIKRAFALLYKSGLNVKQALEKSAIEFPDGPGREFFDFIAATERGVCTMEEE